MLKRPITGVLAIFAVLAGGAPAAAQFRIGSGSISDTYETHCAACHGADLAGGLGGSLIDDVWTLGDDDAAITQAILDGFPDQGMQGFADTLTAEEVRALVIYIREHMLLAEQEQLTAESAPSDGVYSTDLHAFALETVFEHPGELWGLAFLPDGRLLVSEKTGALLMVDEAGAIEPVAGIPEAWAKGQGGLLDVALHPGYGENGWVYLALSASSGEVDGEVVGQTKVVRGRIADGAWVDEEAVFEAPPEFHSDRGFHFGTRLVFDEGYLFFAIGDRGEPDSAQDLSRPNGKMHRIHDDGRIPDDNPFLDVEGAYPTVWSYGHRNPQGIVRHPATGALYDTEHGPRGGDELNRVERGVNYGWPVITYGMNYDGTPITDKTAMEGMAQPLLYWTPSIAACGLAVYEGEAFPEWRGDLFAGGLATQEVRRLRVEGDVVIADEIILKGQGRVRDIKSGPDGSLYVVVNRSRDQGDSAIFKFVSAEAS
ncbi:MAG: PQQ-dependent sugar dehydrogenase [Caulobacterales bacterium]|nr:PQQ-dependent sugar dehydrogenase [Caulobacterales bacterium]